MVVPFTIYVYGKENYTKDNPKKINEDSEGKDVYEARKNLFDKYRANDWWVFAISEGDKV